MMEYNPKQWARLEGATVGQLCSYMGEHLPENAVFNVCGCDRLYLHVAKDSSMVSVDDHALWDLPEYGGYEPQDIGFGAEGGQNGKDS